MHVDELYKMLRQSGVPPLYQEAYCVDDETDS